MADTTKYLDQEGVKVLWKKIRQNFFSKTDGEALTASVDDLHSQVNQLTETTQNQKSFSYVKIGEISVAASSADDTIEFVGGSNVTLTPDESTKTIKIDATDTTYDVATASSDGLMASSDKTKLDSIEASAQINLIESISVNGETVTPDDHKAVALVIPTAVSQITNDAGYQTADDVKAAINSAVASVYVYKGSVEDASQLPTSGQTVGDVYNIVADSDYGPAGMNVAWTGDGWDSFGSSITIAAMTEQDINEAIEETEKEAVGA